MKIQSGFSCFAVLVAMGSFWSQSVAAAPDPEVAPDHDAQRAIGLVKEVRDGTRRFRDVQEAEKEGWGLFLGCVSGDQEGAMGIHYVNGALVDDPALDPQRPEALIYEPFNGRLQLVGAEFVVIAEAWDAANPSPPVLLGQMFHYEDSPNRYGLPPFYALHVWAWKHNTLGMFVDWNPDVSCEQYAPE